MNSFGHRSPPDHCWDFDNQGFRVPTTSYSQESIARELGFSVIQKYRYRSRFAPPRTGIVRYRSQQPEKDTQPCNASCDVLPVVNEGASLNRGNPDCFRSVSGPSLPASAGRVSSLGRERPVAPPRVLPSASESSPRGFSTRLSPKRSNLTVPVPAPVTPCRPKAINRACGAPQTWVDCGPTPTAYRQWESAEPVRESLTRAILSVGVPVGQSPVVCDTERTRFTPAVNDGILSLFKDRPEQGRTAGEQVARAGYRPTDPVAVAQTLANVQYPSAPGLLGPGATPQRVHSRSIRESISGYLPLRVSTSVSPPTLTTWTSPRGPS